MPDVTLTIIEYIISEALTVMLKHIWHLFAMYLMRHEPYLEVQ